MLSKTSSSIACVYLLGMLRIMCVMRGGGAPSMRPSSGLNAYCSDEKISVSDLSRTTYLAGSGCGSLRHVGGGNVAYTGINPGMVMVRMMVAVHVIVVVRADGALQHNRC